MRNTCKQRRKQREEGKKEKKTGSERRRQTKQRVHKNRAQETQMGKEKRASSVGRNIKGVGDPEGQEG
jgi:hypothetical protein